MSLTIEERLANAIVGQTNGCVPTLSVKCIHDENLYALKIAIQAALQKRWPTGCRSVFYTAQFVVITFDTVINRDAYHTSLAHLRTGSTKPDDATSKHTVFGAKLEADALVKELGCVVFSHGCKHVLTLTAPQLTTFTSCLGWNGKSYEMTGFALTTDSAENDANRARQEAYHQAVDLAEEDAGRIAVQQRKDEALAHLRHAESQGSGAQANRTAFMACGTPPPPVMKQPVPDATKPTGNAVNKALADAEMAHDVVMKRLAAVKVASQKHRDGLLTRAKMDALATATAAALAEIEQMEAEMDADLVIAANA